MMRIIYAMAVAGLFLAAVFGRQIHEDFLYSYVEDSIVKVQGLRSSGTAFFVEWDGRYRLLTAAHVCRGNFPMLIEKGEKKLFVFVIKEDAVNDLCELGTLFPIADVSTLELRPSPEERHEIIATLGFAWGFPLTMYVGRTITKTMATEIVGTPPCKEDQKKTQTGAFPFGLEDVCTAEVLRLYTTAFTGPGHSGGVLVDFWGRVRGMIVQVFMQPPSFSVGAPGEKIIEFLDATTI